MPATVSTNLYYSSIGGLRPSIMLVVSSISRACLRELQIEDEKRPL